MQLNVKQDIAAVRYRRIWSARNGCSRFGKMNVNKTDVTLKLCKSWIITFLQQFFFNGLFLIIISSVWFYS